MKKADVVAYSYIRFSSPEQAEGDSERRQTEQAEAYCARRGWTLDRSLKADRGVSAFRGKNAMVGNLRAFFDRIESGDIKPGSALVVESVDRISRQGIDEGYDLCKSIIKKGIILVTLSPEREFGPDAVKSLTKGALELQLILERAAEESERKSQRVGAAWGEKKRLAREGKVQPPRKKDGRLTAAMTARLPAWVEERGGEMRLIPERAAVVKRIYALAAGGYGLSRIMKVLEREQVPPFGDGAVRPGKSRGVHSGRWARSYVQSLLKDRRAAGEFQPRTREGKPDGPPIAGYYPAAITEDEWLTARAGARKRQTKEPARPWAPEEDEVVKALSAEAAAERLNRSLAAVHQRRGKLGLTQRRAGENPAERHVNVFARLLFHARDGDSMFCVTRVEQTKTMGAVSYRALVNTSGFGGRGQCYSFPYPTFERAVLSCIREIPPDKVLGKGGGPSEADVIGTRLSQVREQLAGLEQELLAGASATIARVVRQLEDTESSLKEQLALAQQKEAVPLSRAWTDAHSLIDALDNADDPDDVRLRLRVALRRMVSGVWALPVQRGRDRLCAAQVHFTDDGYRSYLIIHRPPKSNGKARTPGRWAVRAVKHPDDLLPFNKEDLRDREQAGWVEGFLQAYPAAVIERVLKTGHELP